MSQTNTVASGRPWLKITLYGGPLLFLAFCILVGMLPSGRVTGPMTRWISCRNNMRQIGIAVHTFAEDSGGFPLPHGEPFVTNPPYSWRIPISRYVSDGRVVQEYNFELVWNDPANVELEERGWSGFRCPAANRQDLMDFRTDYVAIVGDQTFFHPTNAFQLDDFHDGMSNTIMVVEIANSDIHWMEPRDLIYDEMRFQINAPNAPSISSHHEQKANVMMADGRVRDFSNDTDEKLIQTLITNTSGEKMEDF